ncbi:MAG: hypothetical protein ACXW09_14915 [Methylococcaceae bacterium]
MTSKSIAHRLAGLEAKMKKSLLPLVIFYRAADGLSAVQQQRINEAKQIGRSVKLIRTFVAEGID